jgi:cyclic lactone autoinducer peptide
MSKIAGGLVVLSMIIATPATFLFLHQPKTPNLLK